MPGSTWCVAAPMRESSGASAGIIAAESRGRLQIERRELPGLPGVEAYAVDAMPAHIVLAATRGWLDPVPDLVLSGVNRGPNTGRAILHSGTVGAALTASVNGVRGLAVSLDVWSDGASYWDTAVHLVPELVELLLDGPPAAVLTLNVPNRPVDALRELRVAPLAEFGMVQARFDRVQDGRLHLAAVQRDGAPQDGTDSALLAAGHPTLTALDSVREAGRAPGVALAAHRTPPHDGRPRSSVRLTRRALNTPTPPPAAPRTAAATWCTVSAVHGPLVIATTWSMPRSASAVHRSANSAGDSPAVNRVLTVFSISPYGLPTSAQCPASTSSL